VLTRNVFRNFIIGSYLFKETSVHKSVDNDDLKTGFETKFGIEKVRRIIGAPAGFITHTRACIYIYRVYDWIIF